MKRYKLAKDLPTFNVGDVFYLNEAGSLIHESDGVPAYTWATIDNFPNILTDWFEEINESTRWKPETGQKYYCFGSDGSVMDDDWCDLTIDYDRFEIGNCFQTKEEAERAVEYLKALAVVRGDATTKFVKDKGNWFVGYDTILESLKPSFNVYDIRNGIFGLPYFATKEDAQRSIEQHKNEWLTIFGFEDSAEEEE